MFIDKNVAMTAANAITAQQKNLSHRRLPTILFVVPVFLSVYFSSLTIAPQNWLSLLWLVPSVVLVGLLTRGNVVLIPAGIGIGLGTWLIASPIATTTALISGLIAPYVASLFLKQPGRPAESQLREAAKLLAVILLVLAPLSALINVGLSGHYAAVNEVLMHFGWQWMIESISAAITVRTLMALMPSDGSALYPVMTTEKSLRTSWNRAKAPLVVINIFIISAVAIFVCHLGYHVAARMAAVVIFGIAGYAALFHSQRQASTGLFTAVFAAGVLRLHTAFDHAPDAVLPYLAEFELPTLFMAIVLTLLNASAEERRTQNDNLHRQASTHPTSGLPNFRVLRTNLISAGERLGDQITAVALVDVSIVGFSRWIDIVGHKTFAKAESDIADFLAAILTSRYGQIFHLETGRFVLLSDDSSQVDEIQRLLHNELNGKEMGIGKHSMSLQYALSIVDLPAEKFDSKLAIATLSLAQSESLTNLERYCRMDLSEDRISAHREQFAWTEKVRSLLQSNRLQLLAQPIADCHAQTHPSFHFEVLARLKGDDGNILTPDKFLPAIAAGGIQVSFDQRVVETAFSLISAYEKKADAKPIGTCAINITGPTISDAGFTSFLFAQLDKYEVQAQSIMIEITESESILDLPTAQNNLQKLSTRGIRIAVDDFGTGLATFDYIRTLQPDVLKIDGSFVKQYATSRLDREIVQSINRLAGAIGAQTVAECVEDLDIAEQMQSIGIDFLQGWGIARPMPFMEMLETYSPSPESLACTSSKATQSSQAPVTPATKTLVES